MRFCGSLNVAILQFPEIKINTSCYWKQKYSHRIFWVFLCCFEVLELELGWSWGGLVAGFAVDFLLLGCVEVRTRILHQ